MAAVITSARPCVLARVDWGLLLVFVLMFIDLRLIVGLEAVRSVMGALGLVDPARLYWVGIGASQLVSNVSASIAMAEYSHDWRVMTYAVNIGGFGFLVGSLANLIALRMARDPRAWLSFHLYSLPCLLVAAVVGYGLLCSGRVRQGLEPAGRAPISSILRVVPTAIVTRDPRSLIPKRP